MVPAHARAVAPGPPPTPSVSSPPPHRYLQRTPSSPGMVETPFNITQTCGQVYDEEPSSNDSAEESLHAETEWSSYLEVPEAFECVFKVGAHSNDPKTLAEAWHVLMEPVV